MFDAVKIGVVSISDRASTGVLDKGIPALQEWLAKRGPQNPKLSWATRLIADERRRSNRSVELYDSERCDLVLTTGGTAGPARRDVTPEATLGRRTR